MTKRQNEKRKLVTEVVQQILENGRSARADGPASVRYGKFGQMSSALTQAGTLLAKMDRGEPVRKPSALQSLLGTVSKAQVPQKRRWFFAAAKSEMPDARKIEQLLKAATKDGSRLVLDMAHAPGGANEDMVCHLPEGASDPVCEPR